MKRYALTQTVVLLLAIASTSRPSQAETGFVTAVMTRAGLIAGFGAGHGTLIFHGHNYPLIFSGTGFRRHNWCYRGQTKGPRLSYAKSR